MGRRADRRRRPPGQAGFTLLEMLVVLFIVGLMAGMVGPRFGAQIERLDRESRARQIEDQLQQLPRRVRLAGRSLILPKDIDRKSTRLNSSH